MSIVAVWPGVVIEPLSEDELEAGIEGGESGVRILGAGLSRSHLSSAADRIDDGDGFATGRDRMGIFRSVDEAQLGQGRRQGRPDCVDGGPLGDEQRHVALPLSVEEQLEQDLGPDAGRVPLGEGQHRRGRRHAGRQEEAPPAVLRPRRRSSSRPVATERSSLLSDCWRQKLTF